MSLPPAFLGMRGTGDFVANQRPESWHEAILRFFPNGDAPLTAMLAKMKTQVVTDPKFHWWTKGLPLQAADMSDDGLYTDVGLTTAYTTGGSAGDFLYAKLAAADIAQFRSGHQVTLRFPTDMTTDVVGKVSEVVANGASSYLKIALLEDDDNSATYDLSDATRVLVSGNMHAEGAAMPDAIAYDPTEWYNNTQIFRTSLEITGTAMETELRTNPQAYAEAQKDILQAHSVEMEKAFWWGVPTVGTGENGKPMRSTLGIIPAIRGGYTGAANGGTTSDYVSDSGYSGKSWLSGGEDWLNEQLEIVFRYGKTQKMAFCGTKTLMAINQIVRNNGDFMWGPDTTVYGIKVREWVTPLGSIILMSHPLFNHEPSTRNIMVIIEPEQLTYRPLKNRDTKFIGEGLAKTNTGYTRRDGIKEEYLTEAGLQYNNPIGWAYLTGFGLANTA